MASEEFWSLTFEEYFAREARYLEQERRWDLRFGMVGATFINWSGKQLREGSPPVTAEALFGYSLDEDSGEDYEMTPEDSIEQVRKFTAPKGM